MMMWPLCVSNISKGKLEFVDKKFKILVLDWNLQSCAFSISKI